MKENFKNILSDHSEVLLDSLLKNEILKDIPIIGTSINLLKGINNLRDRAYLNKIKYFLKHIGEVSEEQKKTLLEESKKDKYRRSKFGESLFTTIEQADSISKVEYLSVAFEAFLNREMDDIELRHICYAINRCFTDALTEIIESEYTPYEIIKNNTATGFTEAQNKGITADLMGNAVTYNFTHLGLKLRDAWKKYSDKSTAYNTGNRCTIP